MMNICGFMDETDDYGKSNDEDQPKKTFQLDFELEDKIIRKNEIDLQKPLSSVAFNKLPKKKKAFSVK